MTDTPSFYTKDERLTRYALSCGYTERYGNVVLSMENSLFCVMGYDNDGKHVNLHFVNLTEARKTLRKIGRPKPKFRYVWVAQGNYAGYWEDLDEGENKKEMLASLNESRLYAPNYGYRLIKRRVLN